MSLRIPHPAQPGARNSLLKVGADAAEPIIRDEFELRAKLFRDVCIDHRGPKFFGTMRSPRGEFIILLREILRVPYHIAISTDGPCKGGHRDTGPRLTNADIGASADNDHGALVVGDCDAVHRIKKALC